MRVDDRLHATQSTRLDERTSRKGVGEGSGDAPSSQGADIVQLDIVRLDVMQLDIVQLDSVQLDIVQLDIVQLDVLSCS